MQRSDYRFMGAGYVYRCVSLRLLRSHSRLSRVSDKGNSHDSVDQFPPVNHPIQSHPKLKGNSISYFLPSHAECTRTDPLATCYAP